MEYRGELKIRKGTNLPVYDDYGHHPTEIKATLQAFRAKYPKSPLVVVYQPHQAKRLKNLYPEFLTAFNEADVVVFLPIYEVVGRDFEPSTFTSIRLATDLLKNKLERRVYYLDKPKKIKEFLVGNLDSQLIKKRPIIIMMGAGDIVNYTPLLLSK